MYIHNSHIGVWGYGQVGQSVSTYAQKHGASVTVFDKHVASAYYDPERNIFFAPEHDVHTSTYDLLVPSPGVNINKHPELIPWCISEYDIYADSVRTPHIGITGSLGKTTITSLIANLLTAHGIPTRYGGNIGTPMLDLLENRHDLHYHVLELSSFQLEHITHAAPDIAVLSNFHPNHLDRHETIEAYREAKCNIFRFQRNDQHAIIPISMRHTLQQIHPYRSCCVIALSAREYDTYCNDLHHTDTAYYISGNYIYKAHNTHHYCVTTIPHSVTFTSNWLIIATIFDILQTPLIHTQHTTQIHTPHRREYIGTYNGIACYDDSKATIMPATYAAVQSLAPSPIILILGGLSKGVERTTYIAQIAPYVTNVICFGAEANQLHTICKKHHIPTHHTETLSEAVKQAFMCSRTWQNGSILFSPGGSSFDLFTSYQERGHAFRHYVTAHAEYNKQHEKT